MKKGTNYRAESIRSFLLFVVIGGANGRFSAFPILVYNKREVDDVTI